MGFFGSSSSHLDDIKKDCLAVNKKAQEIRDRCDKSLKGKHEMMDAEDRSALLKQARAAVGEAKSVLEKARQREHQMEADSCPSEDIMAAHNRILEATLDLQRSEKFIDDGRRSLQEGVAEIEAFFGANSTEAKQIRRVIADLDAH